MSHMLGRPFGMERSSDCARGPERALATSGSRETETPSSIVCAHTAAHVRGPALLPRVAAARLEEDGFAPWIETEESGSSDPAPDARAGRRNG